MALLRGGGDMSAEDTKKFMAHVKRDARLRKRLTKETKGAVDRVIKVAKANGYKVTKQELHDHLKKQWGAKKMPTSRKADAFTCIIF
jgi:predicted ribosomally synthesized peptide with nif11-like leader